MTQPSSYTLRLSRLLLLVALLMPLALSSCQKIPVGYLHVQNVEFVPDVLHAYHHPDPSTPRATNGAPWVSTRIQGVAGTNPINYRFRSVKVSEGGDAALFEEIAKQRHLDVSGGLIRLSQEGTRCLPLGRYTLTLEVYNEGHSAVLTDIITIVVEENESN